MSQNPARLIQIKKVLQLQRNQIHSKIHQIKETIRKKQHSIETLQSYALEYKASFYNTPSHRAPTYQNSQQFFDKLAGVLYTEQEELKRLHARQSDFIVELNQMNQKIDGVQEMLQTLKSANQQASDAKEDMLCTALASYRPPLLEAKHHE